MSGLARALPARAVIDASAARVLAPERLPERLRFSTDTRSLVAGDAFVALRGETFDGHAFVREALAAGASAVVVSDAGVVPPGESALIVADTSRAYLEFAGVARRAARVRVVAVTGSAGKTTTKAFAAQILEAIADAPVAATPQNENNEIGVAKLFLGLKADVAYVVAEFGARHYGDIEPLARAALPEVGVLTNIGEAHLEIMGSPERLAETKWGLFATGAYAVLNANDAATRQRATSLKAPATWFAAARERTSETHRSVTLVRENARDALIVREPGANARAYPASVTVAGEHNRENVAAAAAAIVALGFAPSRVAGALAALRLPGGRYERVDAGGVEVIYDAYNASPSGMLATLASFAREPASRRIAVLGSMAELGPDAAQMHARVGAAAARSDLDALLVGGDFAGELARGAREAGFPVAQVVPFERNADALRWLRANTRSGDLVLLKASRRYTLEDIVEGLRAAHAG